MHVYYNLDLDQIIATHHTWFMSESSVTLYLNKCVFSPDVTEKESSAILYLEKCVFSQEVTEKESSAILYLEKCGSCLDHRISERSDIRESRRT